MAREPGTCDILAEMVASVLSVDVDRGQRIEVGQSVMVLESMKMEIPVLSEVSGTVTAVRVAPGDVVQEGSPLVSVALT